MTFDAHEISVELATPVEVYEITAGSVKFFYTSSGVDQVVGVTTYLHVDGLKRGKVIDGPNKRSADFQIELPTSDALAQIFVGTMPGVRVRVEVRRFHSADTPTPQVIKIFDGYVQGAQFTNNFKTTVLTSRQTIDSIGRTVPRRTFKSGCNHVLYDVDTCQVDDTDVAFRASGLTVASMVGNVLTLDSGLSGTYTDGFMNGGFIEVIGVVDFRMIQIHAGNVLTMHNPFAATPMTVNVFAGCGHTIGICNTKFNNVEFFGGFAFVPGRNPFVTGLQ